MTKNTFTINIIYLVTLLTRETSKKVFKKEWSFPLLANFFLYKFLHKVA